ncbi:hypothetical protein Trydic_g4881 [Trypoxylus dichotomus]
MQIVFTRSYHEKGNYTISLLAKVKINGLTWVVSAKRGAPNGQKYEYEYVHYYYDDENDEKEDKDGKLATSHDNSARNEISSNRGRYSEKTKSVPEVNEVVPSRTGTRDRQILSEDTIDEERLPVNTRFPPTSRNLNTTPLPEEEPRTRGPGRGTTTETSTEAESYSLLEVERGPISEGPFWNWSMVPVSIHSSSDEPPVCGPSFPTNLPAGPVRFLGAAPNEREDLKGKIQDTQSYIQSKDGDILTETGVIVDRWKQNFQELLNEEVEEEDMNEQEAADERKQKEISMEELEEALNKLKNGKASVSDEKFGPLFLENEQQWPPLPATNFRGTIVEENASADPDAGVAREQRELSGNNIPISGCTEGFPPRRFRFATAGRRN